MADVFGLGIDLVGRSLRLEDRSGPDSVHGI